MLIDFKKIKDLKPLDYIIISAVILVIAIGVLVVLGKNKFSKSPVEATKKIAFQVMIRSVSITDNMSPFRIGDDAFITIRNVPYTKLKIIDAKVTPKKVIIPVSGKEKPYTVAVDESQPFLYDAIISLIDEAKITSDGPVVGGNKIKIGLPIVLEGFNYRVSGTITNVQALDDRDVIEIYQYIEQQKAIHSGEKTDNK